QPDHAFLQRDQDQAGVSPQEVSILPDIDDTPAIPDIRKSVYSADQATFPITPLHPAVAHPQVVTPIADRRQDFARPAKNPQLRGYWLIRKKLHATQAVVNEVTGLVVILDDGIIIIHPLLRRWAVQHADTVSAPLQGQLG